MSISWNQLVGLGSNIGSTTSSHRRHSDRLVICGDFNIPGANSCSCDDELMSSLDTMAYQQLMKQPTRHDVANGKDNLPDLRIVPQPSSAQASVHNTRVVGSQGLSDHDMVVCELSVRRY